MYPKHLDDWIFTNERKTIIKKNMNYWIYDLLNVYAELGIEDHIEPRGSIPK